MEDIENAVVGHIETATAMVALLVGARLVVRFTTATIGTITYVWFGDDNYLTLSDNIDCRTGDCYGTQFVRFYGPAARDIRAARAFLRDYHDREEATEARIAARQ